MTRTLLLVAVAALVLAGCTAADASTSAGDPAPEQAPVESAMADWEALPEFQQAGMCRLLLTDGEAYRANASSAEGYAMFDVMDEACPTLTVTDVAESIPPPVHWNLVAMGVSSVGPDGSPATTYELAGALAQAFYRSGPPSLDDLNVSFRAPAGHIYQSLVTQGGMDFPTYDRIFIAMRDLVSSGESRLDGSDVSEAEPEPEPVAPEETYPDDDCLGEGCMTPAESFEYSLLYNTPEDEIDEICDAWATVQDVRDPLPQPIEDLYLAPEHLEVSHAGFAAVLDSVCRG